MNNAPVTLPDPESLAQPLPRMTDADVAAAREKIRAYLAESEASGINLRPITGQILRLSSMVGLDLEALGRADDDDQSDEDYFEEVMLAVWILSAGIETVVYVCGSGDRSNARDEASGYALKHLPTLAQERAALRAFIARWLEYRIELQILQQPAE
jgi:hypothetical protein